MSANNLLCLTSSLFEIILVFFFFPGNHEYFSGDIDSWFQYAKDRGFTVLHNSNKKIKSSKDKQAYICMAGVDDIQANAMRYVMTDSKEK